MSGIMEKIEFNNKVVAEMEVLEERMTTLQQKDGGSGKRADESSKKQSKTDDSNKKKGGEDADEVQTKNSEIRTLRLQSLIRLV